jgi:hypothetical protein
MTYEEKKNSGINYDGGKERAKAIKEGALHMKFEELKNVFTLNTFN